MNVRQRLQMLERSPQFLPAPSPLEQIKRLALQSLCLQDLNLLKVISEEHASKTRSRELSEAEAAACVAWGAALETEARRMGLKSFAGAKQTARQRR